MDKDWYFIGLWLGDGSKESTSITTADKEIIQYLQELASKYKLQFSTYTKKGKNKAVEVNLGSLISYTKAIIQYSLEGQLIKKYTSIKEASLETGIIASSISHNAAGKYAHAGGYIWKYGEQIYYNTLRQQLKELNLINNKHIPTEIFTQSSDKQKQFLAGLIDSDGTKNYQTISITQKNKGIIVDLERLCKELNYFTKVKGCNVKGCTYYKLTIKGDLRDIPVLLDRKRPTKISKFNNG